MPSDYEIGHVVAIDTSQVTIELHADIKAMTRTTYEHTVEVGKINSYVVLPVGAQKIVAMIIRVMMVDESEFTSSKTLVTLPSARRLMKAVMIGTIDGKKFAQGIRVFPILNNQVLVATKSDLDAIFGADGSMAGKRATQGGYCIPIGRSVLFPEFEIKIDPDVFFGKHAAVIGSTGSGKSCTISTIIQSVLERPEVKQTRFIILDTNGEYRTAFQSEKNGEEWKDVHSNYKCLYIPTEPANTAERLTIPYWFMSSDDFTRLFRAQQGVQRPVLLEALRLARNEGNEKMDEDFLKEQLIYEINRIWSLSGSEEKTSKDISKLCYGMVNVIKDQKYNTAWEHFKSLDAVLKKDSVVKAFEDIKGIADGYTESGKYPSHIPPDAKLKIQSMLDPIYQALTGQTVGKEIIDMGVSVDAPGFFGKHRFRSWHLDQALRRQEAGGARARDYCGTMLLRITRLLEDSRFDFLFGSSSVEWPEPLHSLATFLRDALGMASSNGSTKLSEKTDVPDGVFPFYDRQRNGAERKNVVIVDLSLLASEVLENVTALIGRLLLEFLQRFESDTKAKIARGSFPVVLILEEAQNYIKEKRGNDDESISREVFERIAREGRKYGLGLVVASQRPSELSRTVLSQCNSFIVHRLQNPEDLRYFRDIVPGIYDQLLGQLPALAPRNALVLGECTQAPALIYMREANPTPKSKDPKFYEKWISEDPPIPDVEAICEKWEGKTALKGSSKESKPKKSKQVVKEAKS